jgi:hypothetical protein
MAKLKDGSRIYGNVTIDAGASAVSVNATTINASSFVLSNGVDLVILSQTGGTTSNDAYAQANSARDQANTGYGQANAAYAQANTARGTANDAYAQANTAYGQANNGYAQANAAYVQANAAYGQANSARDQANTARGTANDAYAAANSKVGSSGDQTITGNVTISGNLVVTGNATTINVSNLSVNDAIILLSANATGDATDIGFVGHFDRGATPTHAGMIRVHTLNEFQIFDNYELEPTNNVIDIANYNYRLGNLRVNAINANSVLILGNAAATQANLTLARDQANTARTTANDAYAQANTARDTANAAYAQANAGYTQANTGYAQANAAYGQANAAYGQANAAYSTANTANTTANLAYAQANSNYQPAVTRLDVTNNGASAYRFDQYGAAVDNPSLYVRAGETIAFNLNNAGHPFAIRVSSGGSNYDTGLTHVATDGTVSTGSSAQGKVSGSLYWKVPYELGGNTYVYQCTIHGGMVGSIVLEPNGTIAYNQANTARNQANTARTTANDAYGAANTAQTTAQNAYGQANTAYGQANDAYGQANTARTQANTAYGQANAAYAQANSAYAQANNAYGAANNIISGATSITLKAYKDFLQANTNVNAANTCDLSVSNYFRAVMTASAQFTFINAPSSGTAQQFSLLIMQNATGGYSPTFANTVYWAGGSIPPATTAANSRDLWTFITYDGGSTYWGTLTMKDAR